MVHATGRALSSGISRGQSESRILPRSLLFAGARGGSDIATACGALISMRRSCLPIFWWCRRPWAWDCTFAEGEGPVVEKVAGLERVQALRPLDEAEEVRLVCETVKAVKARLPADMALIGFCGAPWTVASYMVGGGGEGGREIARVVAASGGRVVRIADRAAGRGVGVLSHSPDRCRRRCRCRFSIPGPATCRAICRRSSWRRPIAAIVEKVRAVRPRVPVIVFARGVGAGHKRIGEMTQGACAGRRDVAAAGLGARASGRPACRPRKSRSRCSLNKAAWRSGGVWRPSLEPCRKSAISSISAMACGPETPPQHVEQVISTCGTSMSRPIYELSVAQGLPYHCGHRLDGGTVLSAAAVGLSPQDAGGAESSETFKVMERRLLKAS